jgi:hypothetical protein
MRLSTTGGITESRNGIFVILRSDREIGKIKANKPIIHMLSHTLFVVYLWSKLKLHDNLITSW